MFCLFRFCLLRCLLPGPRKQRSNGVCDHITYEESTIDLMAKYTKIDFETPGRIVLDQFSWKSGPLFLCEKTSAFHRFTGHQLRRTILVEVISSVINASQEFEVSYTREFTKDKHPKSVLHFFNDTDTQ